MRGIGRGYDEAERRRAVELYLETGSKAETARRLSLPRSTVARWIHALECETDEKSPERKAEREALRRACEEEEAALGGSAAPLEPEARRRQAQEQFERFALSGIEDAIRLGGRRIRRALTKERELDALLALVEESEISAKEKTELLRKVRELQVYSIRELTGFINAVYDKVELAPEVQDGAFEVRILGEAERYAE